MKTIQKIDMMEIDRVLENCDQSTKLYIGCDSRVKDETINYTSVIVIHLNGCNGGMLFYEKHIEPRLDIPLKKPSVRLMREVYFASELYLRLVDESLYCLDKDIEVHLDINPNKIHKSSLIVQQAVGYVVGTCQVQPKLKPHAWAASCVADTF